MANKRENTEAKSEQFEPRVTALVCAMLMFFTLSLFRSLSVYFLYFFSLVFNFILRHTYSTLTFWQRALDQDAY